MSPSIATFQMRFPLHQSQISSYSKSSMFAFILLKHLKLLKSFEILLFSTG